MLDPQTRPPGLTEADVSKLAALLEKRGASVNIQDPRVSQIQTWLIGLVGFATVSAMAWMASSIDSLNRTMERAIVKQEYFESRQSYFEARLQKVEDRRP